MNCWSQQHPNERIVVVLDGAGRHSSKALTAPANMRLLPLPPCAPELNPVEHLWDNLREKCFHNKVFNSIDALEDDLAFGLLAMENSPEVMQSITFWPWLLDVLSKRKWNKWVKHSQTGFFFFGCAAYL